MTIATPVGSSKKVTACVLDELFLGAASVRQPGEGMQKTVSLCVSVGKQEYRRKQESRQEHAWSRHRNLRTNGTGVPILPKILAQQTRWPSRQEPRGWVSLNIHRTRFSIRPMASWLRGSRHVGH